MAQTEKQRLQRLAGIINEMLSEDLGGGSSIHILNDHNARIVEKPVNGFPYKALHLKIEQDLSEGDIDKLTTELKAFKDQLNKLNTPQTPQ